MKKPSRTLSISLILVLTLSILSATVAFAAPPLAVHIEVYEEILAGPDTFNVSGPAEVAGVICPTGTVDDITFYDYKPANNNFRFLFIEKLFTCAGTSGTFTIEMKVKLNQLTGDTTAKWEFTGGTGLYSGLQGKGKLVGIPDPNNTGFILDIYDGKVK